MDVEATGAIDRVYNENNPALIFFGDKNTVRQQEAFSRYANSIEGQPDMLFYTSDLKGSQGKALKDMLGVRSVPFVALVRSKEDESLVKYFLKQEVSVENLGAFVGEYKAKKLKPDYKSEPIPAENNEPVKVIVGDNYIEQVQRADKYVLVEFYGDDCPHCQKVRAA